MKTIIINSLKLTNFKGIRSLDLKDLSQETFIYGNNGTGKTTIFDAFTWLLFGKDSSDRTTFEIKTLDKQNNFIQKIDHEVEAELLVDGVAIRLKRTLKQDWVKPRGALESVFNGHTTLCEWNGTPMKVGEFVGKINTIVDEKVFKIITNPYAFNSLDMNKQRDVLIDMSGNITDADVARGNAEFETLVASLIGKSFEERKREVKATMTKSKAEIKTIPTRIDEVERSKPTGLDFATLKTDLESKNKAIEYVNSQISDKLKAQQADLDRQKEIQQEIYSIETAINSEKHQLQQKASEAYNNALSKPREIQRKIDAVDGDIKANETSISNSTSRIGSYKNQIITIDKSIADLRKEWEEENAKSFVMDENDCACPTCKRAFEAADVEEKKKDLQEHFDSNKKSKLKSITERGQSLSGQKMTLENNVIELQKEVQIKESENKTLWENRADLSKELIEVSIEKTQTQFYDELLKEKQGLFAAKENEIAIKREALNNRPKVDASDLKAQLDALNNERDLIKNELQKEALIKQADERIAQLEKEESALAQAIADVERELFTMEAFEKEKSSRIEESVNLRFQFVSFKLFETQINGSEVPTCVALVNGVPITDVNNASRINAGLDIINTLSEHYQANAPVFVDNAESIVKTIPIKSQLIKLIVSEADNKLRIESNSLKEVLA